MKLIFQSL